MTAPTGQGDDLSVALGQLRSSRQIVDRLVAEERAQLAAELRAARESASLTQQAVADLIGVTRPQVANMETGQGMSVESLIGYAAAVGFRLNLASTR